MIFKKSNLLKNLNSLFQYLAVVLISGFTLASIFIALPQTENLIPEEILEDRRFDLNTKDENYWKQEFYLELEEDSSENEIEETKNIIYQRLRKAEVEEIQVKNTKIDAFEGIKVTVQTTQEKKFINDLISERGYMELVIPKDDMDQEEEGMDAQMYMRENYESTKWDRESFRNILIRQLPDEQHNQIYFAIFKEWPQDRGEFNNFLREHQGDTIGLAIDNFVRPIPVDEYAVEIFAVGLGPNEQDAMFHDIILNTGIIPVRYFQTESNEIEPQIYEIDHIQATLAIIASIIILTGYLYIREKETVEKMAKLGLCMLLTFSTTFSILKMYQIPVDLFLLVIAGLLSIIFIKMIYLRYKHVRALIIFSLLISILMILFGTGYVIILGKYIAFIILLSIILQAIIRYYFETVKLIFR